MVSDVGCGVVGDGAVPYSLARIYGSAPNEDLAIFRGLIWTDFCGGTDPALLGPSVISKRGIGDMAGDTTGGGGGGGAGGGAGGAISSRGCRVGDACGIFISIVIGFSIILSVCTPASVIFLACLGEASCHDEDAGIGGICGAVIFS